MRNKIIKLIKRPIVIVLIVIIIGLVAFSYFYFKGGNKTNLSFIAAKRGEVLQEVSVTGRVKPVESVALAFEKSGKVAAIYYDVGQEVEKGGTIVTLENSDLAAQLRQAQASFEVANANYLQYKNGTRPEEINAAKTQVANSEKSLTDAENNLTNVENKAKSDLDNTYQSALTAVQKSASVAKTSLLTLTDIQYAHFNSVDQESINLENAKADAVFFLLGTQNAGLWQGEFISKLTGGAFGDVQNAAANPSYENIDKALANMDKALQYVKAALDIIPVNDTLTSTEKTNIGAEKTNISTETISVETKEQATIVQKATNSSNISTAHSSVTTVQNTLASARDNLALEEAGYTEEQIAAQKAQMDSAKANVDNLRAQLGKTILRAPFKGLVIKQDAEIGGIVSAQTPIVSIISESNYEIETYIPEVDIAKIKPGDSAKVTLDAYGEEVVFQAEVFKIEPAETIIEDVPTYKVELNFLAKDDRIKSGMTANTDITTEKKENVLFVPYRAVSSKDGAKYVSVKKGNVLEQRKIETGLKGSDGNIEIISGLQEGEEVVNFTL